MYQDRDRTQPASEAKVGASNFPLGASSCWQKQARMNVQVTTDCLDLVPPTFCRLCTPFSPLWHLLFLFLWSDFKHWDLFYVPAGTCSLHPSDHNTNMLYSILIYSVNVGDPKESARAPDQIGMNKSGLNLARIHADWLYSPTPYIYLKRSTGSEKICPVNNKCSNFSSTDVNFRP